MPPLPQAQERQVQEGIDGRSGLPWRSLSGWELHCCLGTPRRTSAAEDTCVAGSCPDPGTCKVRACASNVCAPGMYRTTPVAVAVVRSARVGSAAHSLSRTASAPAFPPRVGEAWPGLQRYVPESRRRLLRTALLPADELRSPLPAMSLSHRGQHRAVATGPRPTIPIIGGTVRWSRSCKRATAGLSGAGRPTAKVGRAVHWGHAPLCRAGRPCRRASRAPPRRTDSWRSFEPVLPYLPGSIRAFALTQRGHGDAGRPAAGYHPRDFAADVAAFLDSQGLESAVIAGHSMGSTVALRFALDYPERTRGLIPMGAFVRYRTNPVITEFWETVVAGLKDPIDRSIAREFQESTLANPIPARFLEVAIDESLKVPARVWRDAFAGLLEDEHVPRLAVSRCRPCSSGATRMRSCPRATRRPSWRRSPARAWRSIAAPGTPSTGRSRRASRLIWWRFVEGFLRLARFPRTGNDTSGFTEH